MLQTKCPLIVCARSAVSAMRGPILASGPLADLKNALITYGGGGNYNAIVKNAHQAFQPLAATANGSLTVQPSAVASYQPRAAALAGTPLSAPDTTAAAASTTSARNAITTPGLPNTAALSSNLQAVNTAYTSLGSPPSAVSHKLPYSRFCPDASHHTLWNTSHNLSRCRCAILPLTHWWLCCL